MAAIDKIYGTRQQYIELRKWIWKHRKAYLPWMYDYMSSNQIFPISNFRCYQDRDLYVNCPLEWVKERIREQYNGDPNVRMLLVPCE